MLTYFIEEFGLILLFIPSAYRWGRGFSPSLRVSGLRLNLLLFLIVIMGGLVTAILHKILRFAASGAGDFLGAVTNTRLR